MKKALAFILATMFITSAYSQILYRHSLTIDTPPPDIGLSGNGVTDIIVQEFPDSTVLWAGTGSGLSRINADTDPV